MTDFIVQKEKEISYYTTAAVEHGAARPVPCLPDFIVQKEKQIFPAQDLNSQPSNLQADALSTTPQLLCDKSLF